MRVGSEQAIQRGRLRGKNGVARFVPADSPTVQDDEHNRSRITHRQSNLPL
jgi:hypothetical protein